MNCEQLKRPRIGIGVLVIKDHQILLGERMNSHGLGTWGAPGGHLEYGETPAECAARELEEEAGLNAQEIVPGPWTNDFFGKEKKHYVTLFMQVTEFKGTPSVKEPEKCLRWEWFPVNELPSPLFLPLENLLAQDPFALSGLAVHF